MFGFKKRRKKLISNIANEVVTQLENQRGWHKFLPPVALRDQIYLVTENGEIFAMRVDVATGMEQVIKITSI